MSVLCNNGDSEIGRTLNLHARGQNSNISQYDGPRCYVIKTGRDRSDLVPNTSQ